MVEQRIALRGEIDLANADKIKVALDYAAATGSNVVIDCEELTFIDSIGIRVLVDASEMLERRNRHIALMNVPHRPRRVFDVLCLGDVLHYDPDMDTAAGG